MRPAVPCARRCGAVADDAARERGRWGRRVLWVGLPAEA